MLEILEHNFFKDMSKGPAFLRQTQIQTLEYGLDDAMPIKTKDLVLILNFQPTWMPKGILTKIRS